MYLWVVQISFCYKICISNKFPVKVAAIVLGLTLWETLFYRVEVKSVATVADHLSLNPESATHSFFDVVSTPFHTKIGTIRIIQIIELLRISNKTNIYKTCWINPGIW